MIFTDMSRKVKRVLSWCANQFDWQQWTPCVSRDYQNVSVLLWETAKQVGSNPRKYLQRDQPSINIQGSCKSRQNSIPFRKKIVWCQRNLYVLASFVDLKDSACSHLLLPSLIKCYQVWAKTLQFGKYWDLENEINLVSIFTVQNPTPLDFN